jgi:hypothetical protein
MRNRDYATEKAAKTKSTRQVMWMLLILLILFTIVIFRVAIRSGSKDGLFKMTPSGDDAFEIAKDYIRPTLISPRVDFADGDFEFTKNYDSVYIVKSYYETKYDEKTDVKTNFTVKLKYNGGTISSDRNWSLLKMEKH